MWVENEVTIGKSCGYPHLIAEAISAHPPLSRPTDSKNQAAVGFILHIKIWECGGVRRTTAKRFTNNGCSIAKGKAFRKERAHGTIVSAQGVEYRLTFYLHCGIKAKEFSYSRRFFIRIVFEINYPRI